MDSWHPYNLNASKVPTFPRAMHSREEDEVYMNDEEVVVDWNQMSFAQRQRDAHEK